MQVVFFNYLLRFKCSFLYYKNTIKHAKKKCHNFQDHFSRLVDDSLLEIFAFIGGQWVQFFFLSTVPTSFFFSPFLDLVSHCIRLQFELVIACVLVPWKESKLSKSEKALLTSLNFPSHWEESCFYEKKGKYIFRKITCCMPWSWISVLNGSPEHSSGLKRMCMQTASNAMCVFSKNM